MISELSFNEAAAPFVFTAEMGSSLPPADVAALAEKDTSYDVKKPLMQGARDAFERGRPENLAAFFSGYLKLKRENGNIEQYEHNALDNGIRQLAGEPLVFLLESSREPQRVIAQLTHGLTPFHRQNLLDIALRTACTINGWSVIAELHAAGADINAGTGRALQTAFSKKYPRCISTLLQCGADAAMARNLVAQEHRRDFDAVLAAATARFAPAPPPRLLSPQAKAASALRLPAPEKGDAKP